VLLEAQATIAGSQRLRGRPLGLSSESGRAHSAKETHRFVVRVYACPCVNTCIYIPTYVCGGRGSTEDTKRLRDPVVDALTHSRWHPRSRSPSLHRVAAGVSARGIPGDRARAQRHDDDEDNERLRAASSCCNFQRPRRTTSPSPSFSSTARNAYRALSTLIVLYRFVLVGLRVYAGLEIIPLVPPAFGAIAAVKGWSFPL